MSEHFKPAASANISTIYSTGYIIDVYIVYHERNLNTLKAESFNDNSFNELWSFVREKIKFS